MSSNLENAKHASKHIQALMDRANVIFKKYLPPPQLFQEFLKTHPVLQHDSFLKALEKKRGVYNVAFTIALTEYEKEGPTETRPESEWLQPNGATPSDQNKASRDKIRAKEKENVIQGFLKTLEELKRETDLARLRNYAPALSPSLSTTTKLELQQARRKQLVNHEKVESKDRDHKTSILNTNTLDQRMTPFKNDAVKKQKLNTGNSDLKISPSSQEHKDAEMVTDMKELVDNTLLDARRCAQDGDQDTAVEIALALIQHVMQHCDSIQYSVAGWQRQHSMAREMVTYLLQQLQEEMSHLKENESKTILAYMTTRLSFRIELMGTMELTTDLKRKLRDAGSLSGERYAQLWDLLREGKEMTEKLALIHILDNMTKEDEKSRN